MIDIGSTEFYIGVPSLPREQFTSYSERLFDAWEARLASELPLDDYAIALDVEEGSIKGSGKAGVALTGLYAFVCGYGSFVQGLQTIQSHATSAGQFLVTSAHAAFAGNAPEPIVKRRGGTLGQLQRLFSRVQSRAITVEEAMAEAERLIGDEAATAPDFLARLNESLKAAPLLPLQINLPMAGIKDDHEPLEDRRNPAPAAPRPKHALPLEIQLRIEIWKETKRGKKNVRVVEI